MTISTVVPVYNAARTIKATLDSILQQTLPADEILVLDDGSTDDTPALLKPYASRVTIFRQENAGVAAARNALCVRATGDLITFLDSDDLWHPRYLESIYQLFNSHPSSVAFFTGHVNFEGYGDYSWADPFEQDVKTEIIPPLQFLQRYNAAPGSFMSLSYCCIPKRVLATLVDEPFKLRMAEDLYFFNRVAPSGPVVFSPRPMVAYRVHEGSLSSDRLKLTEAEVHAFELLEKHYEAFSDPSLIRVFGQSFAAKRRLHAKVLMGAGLKSLARDQLRQSFGNTTNLLSLMKSLRLLLLSYLPKPMRPRWPPRYREYVSEDLATGGRS